MSWDVVLILVVPIALVGHAALWISFWNNIQGTAMPLWMIDLLAHLAKTCLLVLPVGVLVLALSTETLPLTSFAVKAYVAGCVLIALVGVPRTVILRQRRQSLTHLRQESSRIHRNGEARRESLQTSNWTSRLLLGCPGNQSFQIEESEKSIEIPRLPRELDGLVLAQISDLHFTGKISRRFFDEAVDLVNSIDADIVAVTGDLVDRREYFSWIPVTIGRLQSKYGVYVVMGNHDCRFNVANLRLLLSEVGLIAIGGRWKQLRIRDANVILAGNELPWCPPAADMADCPSRDEFEQLRILLSHTPDQLEWARCFDFDVMLAGHTHGGQFCLPFFGPVVCPMRHRLEYATGTVYSDPTLLHVNRGLSAKIPLRLNCRPEVTKLVLRCPAQFLHKGSAETKTRQLEEVTV